MSEKKRRKLVTNKRWVATLWERCVVKPMRERKERHTARNLAKARKQ